MSLQTITTILSLVRRAGLTLPPDAAELVETATMVRAIKDDRGEQHPDRTLREVPITPKTAGTELRDLADRYARAAHIEQAAGGWLAELDRRIRDVLATHAEEMINELGENFEAEYAPIYRRAAKVLTPDDTDSTAFKKGGPATTAWHEVAAADGAFASVLALVRGELGELAGELGVPRAIQFLRDDDTVDRDTFEVLAGTGGSLPLAICHLGHDLHVNTVAEAYALIVAAKARQERKERESEVVLVVPRTDNGLRALPHEERVRRGAETGADGGTIVARRG